jgi:TonB-dependent Receptor Plug Domain
MVIVLAMATTGRGAAAQTLTRDTAPPPRQPDTTAHRKATATLDTVVTQGRVTSQVGTATTANQGTVGAADLALRPLLRPAEVVEIVPGVIVTQHSGSGKANQYFLRGFNLDHGTDLALSVDDVPVNMPSHAHGQGYSDLNFVIPELIERVDYRKGPYYADVGDFGSAGAFNIRYYDSLPVSVARLEGGQAGYGRGVLANNARLGDGNLIYAGEFEHNNGPWEIGDNERKYDGVLRYSQGDPQHGVSVTGMAYHNQWRATDQVPDRAIAEGRIDRYGAIDTTDGGNTGRFALNAGWHSIGAHSMSHADAYAEHYDLDLFSNFTYFLFDPLHGDQIEQHDNRSLFGGQATHTIFGTLFGRPSQFTVGVQARNDDIENGLYHTETHVRLNAVTVNDIGETNVGPFAENRTSWTRWLRTVVGVRGDYFWFNVHNDTGGTSANVASGLLSPKASVVFGPWAATEFYVNGGSGYHSNDARGIVSQTAPATPLPRSEGAEAGVRTSRVPGLQSSVTLWLLDLKSELLWDADAGSSEPSGPTRRYGVESANYYVPVRWLAFDADYAWSHARYTDHEAAGDYVPEALAATFDGGIAAHDLPAPLARLEAGVRVRYFGPRSLTQNDSVSSKATTLVYADLGYAITDHWIAGVNIFNLLNTYASDIDYYYVSRLPGEPATGVADIHTHPAEPREFRATVTYRW